MESTLRDATPPAPRPVERALALTVVHHEDPRQIGQSRLFAPGEVAALGRGLADVPGAADDPRLSRKHAALTAAAASLRVEDLGSANGTFLNGERVRSADLAPGDVLGVGSMLLLLHQVSPSQPPAGHPTLLGFSRALGRVLHDVSLVAPRPTTALILGETGTGKELVAREIHALSGRKGAFVAVNCGALSDSVLQSELFGHTRGAFTGADRSRRGLVEQADGGTLFLDEIGEASPTLQSSLLRLLQEREVRAVGSDRAVQVDVRFVAATWRPLEEAAAEGLFRPDLTARLSRWVIRVPALRERPEDITTLAAAFAARFAGRPVALSRGLALALVRHPWPGNVRELEAVLERLVVEAGGADPLELSPEGAELLHPRPRAEPAAPAARAARRPHARPSADELRHLLAEQGGNMKALANALGVGRSTLYRWMAELGVSPDEGRALG